MGQAKLRLQKVLAKQPYCIFCGGTTPANSLDHCPPKSIFDGFRPKGLEFPQCEECREGTRQIDLIMGWFTRIYPDPKTPEAEAKVREHIRGFINNHRDLAESVITGDEVEITYRGQPAFPLRLGANSPLHRVANAFTARLAIGLYYDATGTAVPNGWPIATKWYSNEQLDQGEELNRLLEELGAPRTLVMGKQAVPDQFRYWSAIPEDEPDSFFAFMAFREAFGAVAVIRRPSDEPSQQEGIFRPGFLKGFRP